MVRIGPERSATSSAALISSGGLFLASATFILRMIAIEYSHARGHAIVPQTRGIDSAAISASARNSRRYARLFERRQPR
jgi:hypothetical protein